MSWPARYWGSAPPPLPQFYADSPDCKLHLAPEEESPAERERERDREKGGSKQGMMRQLAEFAIFAKFSTQIFLEFANLDIDLDVSLFLLLLLYGRITFLSFRFRKNVLAPAISFHS